MYFTSECHQSVSYWHRAIGNKWRPPKGLAQSEFMEYVKFRALEPVSIISPLSELRIVHRLSCWIPESFRKVLEFFESLYQPSGPVGKTKPAGSFGSVCWNGSLGDLICLCWFLVIRSRN